MPISKLSKSLTSSIKLRMLIGVEVKRSQFDILVRASTIIRDKLLQKGSSI